MATKKQTVAEVLYDLPTNKMSTELIRWIMSHLPEDSDERGKEAVKPENMVTFSDKDQAFEMVGLSIKEIVDLTRKFQNSFPESANEKGSARRNVVLNNFYPQLTEKEKAYLVIEGVPAFQRDSVNIALSQGDTSVLDAMLGPDAAEIPEEQKKELIERMAKLRAMLGKGGLGGLLGGLLGGR